VETRRGRKSLKLVRESGKEEVASKMWPHPIDQNLEQEGTTRLSVALCASSYPQPTTTIEPEERNRLIYMGQQADR
jgi:hypothetical protein